MGERYVHVPVRGARTPHDVLVREVGEGGAPPGRRARLLLPPCARPAAGRHAHPHQPAGPPALRTPRRLSRRGRGPARDRFEGPCERPPSSGALREPGRPTFSHRAAPFRPGITHLAPRSPVVRGPRRRPVPRARRRCHSPHTDSRGAPACSPCAPALLLMRFIVRAIWSAVIPLACRAMSRVCRGVRRAARSPRRTDGPRPVRAGAEILQGGPGPR